MYTTSGRLKVGMAEAPPMGSFGARHDDDPAKKWDSRAHTMSATLDKDLKEKK